MDSLFLFVTHSIDTWGYWAIFAGMALESANIPIPSELIFGFAGYLVYLGRLSFEPAVFYGVAGGLLGSIASYAFGYYGGRPFILKYGKYFFATPSKVDLAQRWFDRYGLTAVFFARLLPVIRTFISLPAGFAKVKVVLSENYDKQTFHKVFYVKFGIICCIVKLVNHLRNNRNRIFKFNRV